MVKNMKGINKFWEKCWWIKKQKVAEIDMIKDLKTLPHWTFEKE